VWMSTIGMVAVKTRFTRQNVKCMPALVVTNLNTLEMFRKERSAAYRKVKMVEHLTLAG
jgi:hypothetical protein